MSQRINIQCWKRIFFSLSSVLFIFILKNGQPSYSQQISEIIINERKLRQIFQTTIATQTKTFTTKFYKDATGLLSYIPYLNEGKWAYAKIQLTTRIGVDLSKTALDISYDPETNNVHLDFGEPYVLDRTWKSEILDNSEGFFTRWELKQFDKVKEDFMIQLIEKESNNILDYFRNDLVKKYNLHNNYEKQILGLIKTREFSLTSIINKINSQLLKIFPFSLPKRMIPLKLSNQNQPQNVNPYYNNSNTHKNQHKTQQKQNKTKLNSSHRSIEDMSNSKYERIKNKFDL